ncbi:MAG TPA: MFS transporter [Polyangiales bacterium]|nr:MFS transporter [Polyangiales bacterium]
MSALRLYYFASYGGLGAVLPLLALAMEARGFRPSQYAWLLALLPLSRLFAPPLWGALADRRLGTSRLIQVNTALAACAMLLLAFARSFGLTVLGFVIWALMSSSLVPLSDAGAYRMLGPNREQFARVRVFGSLGFLLTALALGVFGVDRELRIPFVVAACGYLAASFASRRLIDGVPTARAPLWPALRELARRPDMAWLWLGAGFHYAGHGVFDHYFGPHARTIPGVSASLVSGAWAIGVGCEVVALWFVPRVLGRRWLLPATAGVAAVRWLAIASAATPFAVLAQQPLHAITFAVWYAVFVHENQRHADPSMRATVQGMASASMGFGTISATLLGGPVLEHFGGRVLFRCAAGAAVLAGVCYLLRLRSADNTLAVASPEP